MKSTQYNIRHPTAHLQEIIVEWEIQTTGIAWSSFPWYSFKRWELYIVIHNKLHNVIHNSRNYTLSYIIYWSNATTAHPMICRSNSLSKSDSIAEVPALQKGSQGRHSTMLENSVGVLDPRLWNFILCRLGQCSLIFKEHLPLTVHRKHIKIETCLTGKVPLLRAKPLLQ